MANAVQSLRRVSDRGYTETMNAVGKTPWYVWYALYATLIGAAGIVLVSVEPRLIGFSLLILAGVLAVFCVKARVNSLSMAKKARVPFYGYVGGICVFGTWFTVELQSLISETRSADFTLGVTLCGISLIGTVLTATFAIKKLTD